MTLIEARGVCRIYDSSSLFRKHQKLVAVDGVSIAIKAGRTLAVVGESGSGKSTLGRLMIGADLPDSGTLRFDGIDLAQRPPRQRQSMARDLQMVFQNALAALDPRQSVERQIAEPLLIHRLADRKDAQQQALALMERVGLNRQLGNRLPLELSGGQRQRVVIARALITQPRFVVFDESVSALDVSVQAQIIELIRQLQQNEGFASMFISHDLRVVRHVADDVAVMYLGRIVEQAPATRLFESPAHPYTRALIGAIPGKRGIGGVHPPRLAGEPPDPARKPTGCAFHPRCPIARALCSKTPPPEITVGTQHRAACHFAKPTPAAFRSATSISGKDTSCVS
ncbi:peptide ABC transporter ATP-binding protein [Falsochrobactrum shanghaiense]|uniref:Peptide ABC transporter ATP-binding protein n=1 Tax=Falsochrobactrum shanghaiense TaxID=2201899 RepID=A0A316J6P8_9HYPH|nr:oligopeptide/dipeptide ABC transporter ATP-binding protein [Falsochrobactrum shanghaiense]PWL17592.1 peptide ABC transporter ATP-binding protein [Falsochrobactrum shanghaiense]